ESDAHAALGVVAGGERPVAIGEALRDPLPDVVTGLAVEEEHRRRASAAREANDAERDSGSERAHEPPGRRVYDAGSRKVNDFRRDATQRNAGSTFSANRRAGSRVSRPKNSITNSVQPRRRWRSIRSITCSGVPQMPCSSSPPPVGPP